MKKFKDYLDENLPTTNTTQSFWLAMQDMLNAHAKKIERKRLILMLRVLKM